jgi:hypothetical protein
VNNKLEVGLGLATGLNSDTSSTSSSYKDAIRSTNQSFDGSFAKKPFNLDYAYAKWSASPWATVIGGKMLLKDVLWEPGDLMWDTDITPEGSVLILGKKVGPADLFLNTGYFILEEDDPSGDDPWVFHLQPGLKTKLTDAISLKTALSWYYFAVGNTTLSGSTNTNSWSSGNQAMPNKDVVNLLPAFELSINEPFNALPVPAFLNVAKLKLFGEYVANINDSKPDDGKNGFMLGMAMGADKIKDFGDWQFKYAYASLGRDAVLDILPDSDRYGGKTSMRGHEWAFEYGVGKNTWLALDIYRTQRIPYVGNYSNKPQTLVQVDWNMKF